jgi:predicted ATP-grasp superfamily ATP-dependent carboligase
VANGSDAVVLGFNRQLARAIGERPYLFAGVIGPVPPSEAMQQAIGSAVRTLAARFRVRGLASLDFVLHGERCEAIELNPRPPASLALYPRVGGHGALLAHLRACQLGVLPPAPAPAERVRGIEIVFARRALRLDAAGAAAIAEGPGVHDLPDAGAAFGPGDPLCSLSASGADADQVQATLARRRDALLQSLETLVDA